MRATDASSSDALKQGKNSCLNQQRVNKSADRCGASPGTCPPPTLVTPFISELHFKFCFASVGTLQQSRAGVHVCCFLRLRAFRGIHPPNQRRKGGDLHPLPNLPFRRTPPTNTPMDTGALTTCQWASHSRREDPSPGTTEAPSQLLQHSHLGHRHKALLGSRPGTSSAQHHKTTRAVIFLPTIKRTSRGGSSAHFFVRPPPLALQRTTHSLNHIPKQDALHRVWTHPRTRDVLQFLLRRMMRHPGPHFHSMPTDFHTNVQHLHLTT